MIELRTWLKERDRAVVAPLAMLGAAVLALVGGCVLIFLMQDREIDESLNTLAIYRAQVDRRPTLETQLKEYRQRLATLPGQIIGTSAPLTQAALENDVKSISDQNGGEIRSAQTLPPTREKGFETIAVQYDLVVPFSRLEDLTYAIESHTPYFYIDDVDIVIPQIWQAPSTGVQDPRVEVRWTIRGYRWVGGT